MIREFTVPLLQWFKQHGRHDLPWQHPKTPYRVYISEIMLQQTQVATVIPFFKRFMARFPTLTTLAQAHEDEVLALWAGLGYYSRARNLHKTAQIIHHTYQGHFPKDLPTLVQLPGIGLSTASALCALAFNMPTAILDGNVKRILSRYFKVEGIISHPKTEQLLWHHAKTCMSETACDDYTQAIMDLGALCCRPKNPDCNACPLQTTCLAFQANVVEQYPQKMRKSALPHQYKQFLLFTNAHQIFLEKRENRGIWGGLWSFPTLPIDACLTTYLQTHAFSVKNIIPLTPFKHTFTHFHLHLYPYMILLNETPPHLSAENWFTKENLLQIGKPKPVQTLLERFWQRTDENQLTPA